LSGIALQALFTGSAFQVYARVFVSVEKERAVTYLSQKRAAAPPWEQQNEPPPSTLEKGLICF
jgi:hypothetical protein